MRQDRKRLVTVCLAAVLGVVLLPDTASAHPSGLFTGASVIFRPDIIPVGEGMTIQDQIRTDQQKQQMERWRILQDTQTKIFEIIQDVTINKARNQDRMFREWDRYIRDDDDYRRRPRRDDYHRRPQYDKRRQHPGKPPA